MKKSNIRNYYIKKCLEYKNTGQIYKLVHQRCYQRVRGVKFIGTAEQVKEILENKFLDGMNWENYGEWEVDHIIPLSKGGPHHWKNIQPLWSIDNRTKHNKI